MVIHKQVQEFYVYNSSLEVKRMYLLYTNDQYGKTKFVGRYSTKRLMKAAAIYLSNFFYEYVIME